jgi:hypothetical protein
MKSMQYVIDLFFFQELHFEILQLNQKPSNGVEWDAREDCVLP